VLNTLNNKQILGSIFCDLTKAFDCVGLDILISKIERYGIICKGKELFQPYIKGRYQRVQIDNKTNHNTTVSNWAMIKHGVPKGSILRPTLFLLYINNFPAVIHKKAISVFFADDTSILCTYHNFVEYHTNIETVFGKVNMWLKKTPFIKH
jgi:hypothetical protein